MMGRKLRFCVAVVTLLMLLVAAPGAEAAKKKKKKAPKPAQQTAQASINPVGRYVRGTADSGLLKVRWANKDKTAIAVDIEVMAPGYSDPYFGAYSGTARLNGKQAVFRGEEGGRMKIEFNGNTVKIDADEEFRSYYCGMAADFDGDYIRQTLKRKK